MELFDYLLAKKKGGGGGSSSDVDWSAIGYDTPPQDIVNAYNYSKLIYDNWEPAENLTLKFQSDTNLIYMPLVDTSIATDMSGMFLGCTNLINIPLLDTSNVITMANMIRGCTSLKTIPLLDTHNVTAMNNMFIYSSNIESIPLLDTSKVTTFNQMFYNCTNLKTFPKLDASKVTDFSYMFYGCNSLTNESLDNILQMCIGATSYTGDKNLLMFQMNQTYYKGARMRSLPHYQDFINAGWSLGWA